MLIHKILFGLVPIALAAPGLFIGCAENEPAMTPASGVAPRYTAREAMQYLASDRCDYAQRCGAIGDGEDAAYATLDECKLALVAAMSERFAGECNHGVAYNDLRACRSEIRNEDCSGVSGLVDSLDRNLACRPGSLCLD